jgi:hypothetical protein
MGGGFILVAYTYLFCFLEISIKEFSTIPVTGINTINHAKYKKVEICPISKKGDSGC